jgi:N-acetylglucosaminyldiphosphoundecaprenol N-acetyl-beta-D-mannosaminyltransferase
MNPLPAVTILNIPVHRLTLAKALACISRCLTEPRLHQIATVNPEFVITAQQDTDFRRILQQADLCLADGVGLLWAARRLGQPIPERLPGSEMVYHLAELAAQQGWRLFLLGAAPGVAEAAAAIFQQSYPGLQIAGSYAGSPDPADDDQLVQHINASRADVLYVAYGAPRQDKWIDRNRHKLQTVRLALGVGGSLDFVTGRAIRAPRWVQRLGLEWLHRLLHEPWRWRRMLALPRFVWAVLRTMDAGRKTKDEGRGTKDER